MNNDYCKHARLGINAQDGRVYLFEPNRKDLTKSKQRRHITNEFVWTVCQFLELKDKPFRVVTDDEIITINYESRKITEEEKAQAKTRQEIIEKRVKRQGASGGEMTESVGDQ